MRLLLPAIIAFVFAYCAHEALCQTSWYPARSPQPGRSNQRLTTASRYNFRTTPRTTVRRAPPARATSSWGSPQRRPVQGYTTPGTPSTWGSPQRRPVQGYTTPRTPSTWGSPQRRPVQSYTTPRTPTTRGSPQRRPVQSWTTPRTTSTQGRPVAGRPVAGRPTPERSSQGRCSQNGYFAHERNCDMYYKCENGTLHEGLCPDGLVFDDKQPPEVLRCDLPFDIDCSYRQALQPPLSTEHCPRLYGLYAHENDCGRFWKCVEGHPYAFNCPEGLAYNEYGAICDWPDQVDHCDSEAILGFRCPVPTDYELQYVGDPLYPYSGDCRRHYVCVLTPDGSRKPRLLACDPGLVFNPETSSCDDPENVSGCQGYYNNLDARRLRELFGR